MDDNSLNSKLQAIKKFDYRNFDDLALFSCLKDEQASILKKIETTESSIDKNIMGFVFKGDKSKPENLTSILLVLQAQERGKLDELITEYAADFELLTGRNKYLHYLIINAKDYTDIKDICNDVLSVFLVTGRPVIAYNNTFHLPLDINHTDNQGKKYHDRLDVCEGKSSDGFIIKDISDANCLKEHQQAYLYYSDEVRDFLFDSKNKHNNLEPIKEYTLDIQEENYKIINKCDSIQNTSQNKADKTSWHLQVGMGEDAIIGKIHKVSYLSYYNGLSILAMEVRLSDELERFVQQFLIKNESQWWHALLTANYENLLRLQLSHWLNFSYYARIIYPSFNEQDIEYKFRPLALLKSNTQNNSVCWEKIVTQYNLSYTGQGIKLGKEKNSIALYFISQFIGKSEKEIGKRLCHLDDDRMFCNIAYSLSGQSAVSKSAKEQLKRLFSQMLYIDRPADSWEKLNHYAFDPDYARQLMERDVCTRWKGLGTLMGFTNYSNVYCGFGKDYKNPIANIHIPFIYGRMLVVCLFYKMSLRMYSRDIASLVSKQKNNNSIYLCNLHKHLWYLLTIPGKKIVKLLWMDIKDIGKSIIGNMISLCHKPFRKKTDYSSVAKDMLCFTNQYYFQQISSQIQGQEIFNKQLKALNIQQEFAFIKEEIHWSDEYQDKINNNRLNRILFFLAFFAFIISLITIKDMPDFVKIIMDTINYYIPK